MLLPMQQPELESLFLCNLLRTDDLDMNDYGLASLSLSWHHSCHSSAVPLNLQRVVPPVIIHQKHQQFTLTLSLLWDRQVAEGACQ